MSRLRVALLRIKGFFNKKALDTNLDFELRSHIDALTEDNIRRGMSPEAARQAAYSEFGGLEQVKENYREQRGLPLLETLLQDVRYGARGMQKSPGFAVVAILTLAIGMGANTAVFSLVETVLLRPLPYRDANRLMLVSESLPGQGHDQVGVSVAEFADYRDRNKSFSQVAAFETDGFNLTGEGTPLRINAVHLSASAFPLLGVNAAHGHTFSEGDDRYGAAGVALLSDALWRNHYGANPEIIGKTIRLDERRYTVIGVMPPAFRFPLDGASLAAKADLWVPEAFAPDRSKERVREFGVGLIARLKPGVTPEQAQADVNKVADDFMRQYPESYSGTVTVAPHAYLFAGDALSKTRQLMLLLQAAVLCVLLIACANVANLLLAKASRRSREMAIRSSIGAGRSRLLRQCLVESFLLSLSGASAGILLAVLLIFAARRFGPADIPQLHDVSFHPLAFWFTLLLSFITTMLFGFVPAWRLSHVSPHGSLQQSTQAGAARATYRLQNCLAVFEIAIALALLIGGSLLLQSFVHLLNVPMGFQPQGVLVGSTIFDWARYPNALQREAVQKQALLKLSALPGVSNVAAASHLPLSDIRQIGFRMEHAAADDFHWAQNSLVSPGYFQTMGIPIVNGRDFTLQDDRNSPNVAVVNETLAKQYLAGGDPIGQRFFWGGRALFTIVGVVADVRISALDADPTPMIYNSMFQIDSGASNRTAFVLRFNSDEGAAQQGILPAVQQQLWSLDKDLPLYGTATLKSLVSESVAQRRFTMMLMAAFAGIALLLSVIGLFGVVSYLVAQRARELAVRIALGAERTQIGGMVLKHGAALGVAGSFGGLSLFAIGSPILIGSLFHVTRFDPFTLSTVPALLIFVSILAAYWPARRAMRVDPAETLRHE